MIVAAGCGQAPTQGSLSGLKTIPVTAERLARDYESDPAAADGTYKERWLAVEGSVEDVDLFPGGRVVVRVAGVRGDPKTRPLGRPVRCEFVPAAAVRVSDLARGQKLTCKGKCAGDTGGIFVDVMECELLDVGPGPTVAVSAAELTRDYARDEKAADARYRDHSLLVAGTVRELKEEKDGALAIVLEGFNEKALFPVRVRAGCPAGRKEEFEHLQKGDKIKIKGECGGNFLGEVVVTGARLVR